MDVGFQPHDVVMHLDPASPLRMVVRAVRGDMCEVAPFEDQRSQYTIWINKILLKKV